jgi:hypothetical protein
VWADFPSAEVAGCKACHTSYSFYPLFLARRQIPQCYLKKYRQGCCLRSEQALLLVPMVSFRLAAAIQKITDSLGEKSPDSFHMPVSKIQERENFKGDA